MTCKERAFASIFALFLVALVAGALLAVTSLMRVDVRRSTREANDAQLRQLLHAGGVAALQRVGEAGALPGEPFDVVLPRQLTDVPAAVRVSIQSAPRDGEIIALIEAHLGDHAARQRVFLACDGHAWGVHRVER